MVTASANSGSEFPRGSAVEVFGLLNAPELNGKCGTVSGFDHHKDRYVVNLSGDLKALKGANLKITCGTTRSAPNSAPQSRTNAKSAPSSKNGKTKPGTDASWRDTLNTAKTMGIKGIKRAQTWVMTDGSQLWMSTPFPKMIAVLLVAGLAVYWMSSDPRYASSTAKYAEPQYIDHPGDSRWTAENRRAGYDAPNTGMGRRVDYNQEDTDYGRDSYGRRDSYDRRDSYGRRDSYERRGAGHHGGYNSYDSAYQGGSSGGSMMWVMLLGGAFLAYKAGLFEHLRGMNFFQMYFLFNIISSMFGGMRMGCPGMGMGRMGMGRRRGLFR